MNDEMKNQISFARNIIIKKPKTHDKETYIYALVIVFVLLILSLWAYLSQGFAVQASTAAQICSFCIAALISFIPAILLAWRIEFIHVKLENERFQKLRRYNLFDILKLVCSFFHDCALVSNRMDRNEILPWQDWHVRYLDYLKLDLAAEESMKRESAAEMLKIHAEELYEEINKVNKLYYDGDPVMHDLFGQEDMNALSDLLGAIYYGRRNHDTFAGCMKNAIVEMQELSFLSKPFSISELRAIQISHEQPSLIADIIAWLKHNLTLIAVLFIVFLLFIAGFFFNLAG